MVRHIAADGSYGLDNRVQPIDCVSVGHFWVAFDHTHFNTRGDPKNRETIRYAYTGDENPIFDNQRPRDIPLARLKWNCVLALPDASDTTYRIGTHAHPPTRMERHLIVTQAGETGDVPHVAAALALDSLVDVIVISTRDTGSTTKANDAATSYRNAVRNAPDSDHAFERLATPADRVRIIFLKSTEQLKILFKYLTRPETENYRALGPASWQTGPAVIQAMFIKQGYCFYRNACGGTLEYPTMTVEGATTAVANSYIALREQRFYQRLTTALTSPQITPAAIDTWATSKMLNLPANPSSTFQPSTLLIVWSRYSGQNAGGGYNPAGDSDPTGQTALIQLGRELGFTVITVGHDPTGGATPRGDIHLGEFWTQDGSPFVGEGRPGQGSLYARFVALRHRVVQVGQKTGGMDNAALVGLPTVYIEDKDSFTIERMRKWSGPMPRYKCAEIDSPPTPVGKAIRVREHTHGSCTLAEARNMVANNPGHYLAGYSSTELATIEAEIRKIYKSIYNLDLPQ